MDARLFDNSHTLRASVLAGLSLFLTGIALFFTIFNISYNEAYVLAGLEFLFAFYSGYIYRLATAHKHTHRHIQYYVYFLITIIGVGSFMQPLGNGLFLWTIFIDLDYFKQVNDEFGHDTGDKVLIETTQLLSQIVGDNNLFRIGGEEFCVTLFDQGLEQAERVGERLRYVIGQHLYNYRNQRIQLTLSVGICEYRDGDNLSDLLKLADVELYRAKKNGRNQVRLCQISDKREHTMQTESV